MLSREPSAVPAAAGPGLAPGAPAAGGPARGAGADARVPVASELLSGPPAEAAILVRKNKSVNFPRIFMRNLRNRFY